MGRKVLSFTALFMIVLLVSAGGAAMSPYLPLHWSNTASAAAGLAWIMAGYSLAKILVGWSGGYIASKFSCGAMIRLGGFFCLLSSGGYLFLSDSVGVYIVLQILYGAGVGLIRPMSAAYLVVIFGRERFASAMGWFEVSFYTALSVGPFLGGLISQYKGAKALFAFVFACNLAAFIFSLLMRCDEIRKRDETVVTYAVSNRLKQLLLYIFCRTFAIAAMSTFLPFFLNEHFRMNYAEIGLYLSVFSISSAVALPLCGHITERLDKNFWLILSSLAVSLMVIALPYIGDKSLLWALCVVSGAFSALTKTVSASLVTETSESMPYVMGLFNSAMNAGFLVASFFGIYLMQMSGVGVLMVAFGFIGILGSVSCQTV